MADILVLANEYTTLLNFRMELLDELLDSGYRVIVALPPNPSNGIFARAGCKVVEVPLERFGKDPLADLRLLFAYIWLIRSIKPQAVLTYTAKPNVYGGLACRLLKIPCICNVTGISSALQSGGLMRWLMLSMQRAAFNKAHTVFFQNVGNMRIYKQRQVVGNQAVLLPGSGVNLEQSKLEPYPSNGNTLRFITVARVRKDKGMDELLEAIRQLSADDPGMEFHLVGAYEEDSYREIIETAVNSMSLFYHGAVSRPEVHALIASSHCLIHPSYHEGMANSLLEAAAAGRPCLASDIPGCREAVEDGKTGYLFEARSAESLVNAIRKFASLPQAAREQMGISGRWKMEKEFDRRKVIAAYLDSIHDAIGMD